MEFSGIDLSSDAGLLLIKQAETNLQICQGITNCLEEKREQHKIRLILDIDGWDALTYGEQQLSLFHGYYRHKIYFPCLINEAKSGYPLILQLRPGNSHSGKGIIGLLRWLFWRLKKPWANVEIILRGDGGFSLPEIINLCERQNVKYVFGFSSNQVLKRKIDYLLVRPSKITICSHERKSSFIWGCLLSS